MVKARIKNPDKVYRRIVKAWQATAKEIFKQSQKNVPVLTGELKASGRIGMLPDGAMIIYTAAHAPKQERGLPKGAKEIVKRHVRKAHRRKPRNKRTKVWIPETFVEEHVKVYPKGYPGKFYLSGAHTKFKPKLADAFRKHLGKGD